MKIIVTGPRDWGSVPTERRALEQALDEHMTDGPILIIHGAAKGADSIARDWARAMRRVGFRVEEKPYPAKWRDTSSKTYRSDRGYDPYAGHARNQMMLDDNKGTISLVFACRRESLGGQWTRGTGDMVARCKKEGLEIFEVVA